MIRSFMVDDRMQSRLLLDAIVITVECHTRRLVFKHQGHGDHVALIRRR